MKEISKTVVGKLMKNEECNVTLSELTISSLFTNIPIDSAIKSITDYGFGGQGLFTLISRVSSKKLWACY